MTERAGYGDPAKLPKLLQVEDSESDAELILHYLRRHGLSFESRRVWAESDFIEALVTFVPDIILSDYSMPAFDGLRALGLVGRFAPATPFIFVSGSIRPADATEALKHGAFDFLLKDDLARLGSAVKQALSGVRSRLL